MASPIVNNWIYATVRIENEAGYFGTGFFVHGPVQDIGRLFLATNKHVVHENAEGRNRAESLKLFFNVRAPEGAAPGMSWDIPLILNRQRLWHEHPNPYVDVLVIDVTRLLTERSNIDLRAVDYQQLFAESNVLEEQHITIGEEVFIIGYPLGLAHSHSYFPIVRQGIIASRIGDEITADIRNPSGTVAHATIPGFMVDAAVVPGSSGSPVVLKPVVGRNVRNRIVMRTATPYLLGIVSAGRIAQLEIEESLYPALADLGIAYNASTIRETIELFYE